MEKSLYIGLMSGTSLDGADAVVCNFSDNRCHFVGHASKPFTPELRDALKGLLVAADNEIERMGTAGIALARFYAQLIDQLLKDTALTREDIVAVGIHGQTIRHCPEAGFTVQLNNPALVAELTGIDVIADFRSRDMAAGGEGAPLVPAFHASIFGHKAPCAIVNIGGIANVSLLTDAGITGFDCGPGNTLLDTWCEAHTGELFDRDASWTAGGKVNEKLLSRLLADDYFERSAPKSTGREYFNLAWLRARFKDIDELCPQDVERTLVLLTARSIAEAVRKANPAISSLYICGGGAFNPLILSDLESTGFTVATTAALGVDPMHVESMAFAWLAMRFKTKKAGNLPAVTCAAGPRILGALYPA